MGDTRKQSHAERLAAEITDDIERLIEAYAAKDGKKAGRVKGLLFANLKALAFGSLGEEASLPEPDYRHVSYGTVIEIRPGDPDKIPDEAIAAAMHEFMKAQSLCSSLQVSMAAALEGARKYMVPKGQAGLKLHSAPHPNASWTQPEPDRITPAEARASPRCQNCGRLIAGTSAGCYACSMDDLVSREWPREDLTQTPKSDDPQK
jgi:hypothetical protein